MSFISARLRNRDPRLGGEAVVREQRRLRLPECDHERARDRVCHVIVPAVGAVDDGCDWAAPSAAAASASPVGPASWAVVCLRSVITGAPSAS